MDKEWIDVADSKIPRRHALPTHATVRAHAKTCRNFRTAIGGWRRAVKFPRITGRNQHPVRVGVYAVDGRPSFAAIRAPQKTTDFDRDVNDVRIIRVKGNALRMRLMGRAGEGPLFNSRHLAEAGKFRPAFSEIVAVEQVRRLSPGINSRLTADQLAGERIDFLVDDTLIPLLPAFARVGASENLAVITAGKEHPARRLENDRADMLIRQHGFLSVPPAVILHEGKDTVHRADEQFVLCCLTDSYRLTSGG